MEEYVVTDMALVNCISIVATPDQQPSTLIFGCMNLLYALADCAICLVFHLYSNVCPAKHVFCYTSGTMSIVKVYVSKDCLFLPFWTLIGGRI